MRHWKDRALCNTGRRIWAGGGGARPLGRSEGAIVRRTGPPRAFPPARSRPFVPGTPPGAR